MPRSIFLHVPSGKSWEVADPIQWCLENAHQPILERARERLLALRPSADPQRVIRLVVRRCSVNLIELLPGRVVVHHWGPMGRADLRPFFKEHSLARQGVEVFVIDRKKELITVQPAADFLYGERLAQEFPLGLYLDKWQRRFEEEPDDGAAAPGSWSSFCWDGIEQGCIPWGALKSAWRRRSPAPCPNCDQPTILVGFGLVSIGMFSRMPRLVDICPLCRRLFQDHSRLDMEAWVAAHLDAEVLPGYELFWGKPRPWAPPRRSEQGAVPGQGR
jgi:hypothetical protein